MTMARGSRDLPRATKTGPRPVGCHHLPSPRRARRVSSGLLGGSSSPASWGTARRRTPSRGKPTASRPPGEGGDVELDFGGGAQLRGESRRRGRLRLTASLLPLLLVRVCLWHLAWQEGRTDIDPPSSLPTATGAPRNHQRTRNHQRADYCRPRRPPPVHRLPPAHRLPPVHRPPPARRRSRVVGDLVAGKITAIGDLVMFDYTGTLSSDLRNLSVEAAVSRQWATGRRGGFRALRAAGSLGVRAARPQTHRPGPTDRSPPGRLPSDDLRE